MQAGEVIVDPNWGSPDYASCPMLQRKKRLIDSGLLVAFAF
jgi:hypothetical protein